MLDPARTDQYPPISLIEVASQIGVVGLKQAETGLKRERAGAAKYKQGRKDGDTASISLTVSRR